VEDKEQGQAWQSPFNY